MASRNNVIANEICTSRSTFGRLSEPGKRRSSYAHEPFLANLAGFSAFIIQFKVRLFVEQRRLPPVDTAIHCIVYIEKSQSRGLPAGDT